MRFAACGLVIAVVLLVGCGGTKKNTVDVTFFQSVTVNPTAPIQGQNYQIGFTLVNADEQKSTLSNVQWTVSRNGVANVFTGTIASLTSHQPASIVLNDVQPAGSYSYVVTIDPAGQIPDINPTNNTSTFTVSVLPLTLM